MHIAHYDSLNKLRYTEIKKEIISHKECDKLHACFLSFVK